MFSEANLDFILFKKLVKVDIAVILLYVWLDYIILLHLEGVTHQQKLVVASDDPVRSGVLREPGRHFLSCLTGFFRWNQNCFSFEWNNCCSSGRSSHMEVISSAYVALYKNVFHRFYFRFDFLILHLFMGKQKWHKQNFSCCAWWAKRWGQLRREKLIKAETALIKGTKTHGGQLHTSFTAYSSSVPGLRDGAWMKGKFGNKKRVEMCL